MEVVIFQVVIAVSIFIAFRIKPQYGFWAACAWTVETVLLLFFLPLILIQLGVIWVTYFVLSNSAGQQSRIDKLKTQLGNHPVSTVAAIRELPSTSLEFVSGRAHKDVLRNALIEATNRLYILSGWLSDRVVNRDFLTLLEQAMQRGVNVAIGYGWEDSYGAHKESKRSKKAFDQLSKVAHRARKKGYSGQLMLAKFGNHEKIIVQDRKRLVLGSNNWLSNTAFKNRERSVVVSDTKIIDQEAERVQRLVAEHAV